MADTYTNVTRILRAALGEHNEHGDRMTVTSVLSGYAEPGYNPSDAVVVLGNWNPQRYPREGDAPLTREENLGPRLAAALERVGAELEWLDEWDECCECHRAIRTEADSYHWKPSYVELEAARVCHECLMSDTYGEDAFADMIDDPRTCVTWCEPSHIEKFGFVKWEPGDEHTYESGWHPGQTDDPQKIFDAIKEQNPDTQVLFFLDENSQFYIRFSAYTRPAPVEDENDA